MLITLHYIINFIHISIQEMSNRKTLLLTGNLLCFEQVDTADGADAHIKLEMAFRREGMTPVDKPLLKKWYEISVPATAPNAESVVNALSKGLELIAADIIKDANQL